MKGQNVKRKKLVITDYILQKVEEMTYMGLNEPEVSAALQIPIEEFYELFANNRAFRLSFEIGKRKLTSTLAKRIVQMALGKSRESYAACKYLLSVKDPQYWSEKHEREIKGQLDDDYKVNLVFSKKQEKNEQERSGNKSN